MVNLKRTSLDFLKTKFPVPEASLRSIYISIGFGLFVGLFLLYFQPFNLNLANYEYKSIKILGYGVISFVITLLFYYVLPLCLPRIFDDERWTVLRHLCFYMVLLFTIAKANGMYANWLEDLPFSWSNFWHMILWTYALGSISTAFLMLLEYNIMTKRHLQAAQSIIMEQSGAIPYASSSEPLPGAWTLQLSNEKSVTIQLDDTTHISADGNYIHIHSIGQIKDQILRQSLSSIETQAMPSSLLRCHRSYIVNMDKVQYVKGNAQGLKLHISDGTTVVPVSRKYIPMVKAYFA